MEKIKQWSMLTALGVVGVMAAGWFLLVSPQHGHAADLRSQAQNVRSATAGLEAQVQQLKAQQKDLAAQQRTLMKIATQIPNNPALPTLIRELSAAAHDAGVTLVSLAPAPPASVVAAAPAVATPSATGAVASAVPAASPLAQIPISVQVTGSYFNIESFFRTVEHLDRAMLTTGFTMGPNSSGGATSINSTTGATAGDPANAAPGALSAQIQAVVFMSPDAAVAAPATAPQTPTTSTSTSGSTTQTPSTTANTAPAATPAQ